MPDRSKTAFPDGCLKLAVLNMRGASNELSRIYEQTHQIQQTEYVNYKQLSKAEFTSRYHVSPVDGRVFSAYNEPDDTQHFFIVTNTEQETKQLTAMLAKVSD